MFEWLKKTLSQIKDTFTDKKDAQYSAPPVSGTSSVILSKPNHEDIKRAIEKSRTTATKGREAGEKLSRSAQEVTRAARPLQNTISDLDLKIKKLDQEISKAREDFKERAKTTKRDVLKPFAERILGLKKQKERVERLKKIAETSYTTITNIGQTGEKVGNSVIKKADELARKTEMNASKLGRLTSTTTPRPNNRARAKTL